MTQEVRFHGFAVTLFFMGLIFLIVDIATGGLAYFLAIPFFYNWWLGNYSFQEVRIEFSVEWKEYLIRILLIAVLNLVTFGLFYPWGECWKWRFLASSARWNNEPLEFTGSAVGYLFRLLLQFIVGAPAMAAAVFVAGLLATPFESFPAVQLGILLVIPGLTLALTLPFVRLIMKRWWWGNLVVGGKPVRLNGNGWDYTRFCLFHLIICILTLGLYAPFFFTANERWLAARMVHGGMDDSDAKPAPSRLYGIGCLVLILLLGGAGFFLYQNPYNWDIDSGKRALAPVLEKANELKNRLEEKFGSEPPLPETGEKPSTPPSWEEPPPSSGDETPRPSVEKPTPQPPSGDKSPSQSRPQKVFKWKDENGATHFTDDPGRIPEQYRDQVDMME